MYTKETCIRDVIYDPIWKSYGRFLFPLSPSYYAGNCLQDLSMAYYNYINPDKTVEICNYLREQVQQGRQVFFDIYSEEEKRQDPSKYDTGLFYFQGKPNAKFAICNAGGAFAFVAGMQDSFPHALELSKQGYHGFALIYRPDALSACKDLARAITLLFHWAKDLQIDTKDYSLWGGSAGGRMAAYLGTYGPDLFGGEKLPRPGAVIMQYTGHNEFKKSDPPTFACCGTADRIASWQRMKRRLDVMSTCGIPTEFHAYENLPHGFGLGQGTVAEGWIQLAIRFWERNMGRTATEFGSDIWD